MHLSDKIEALPKTSAITTSRLKSLQIETIEDFINYFPSRYVDYSTIVAISNLKHYFNPADDELKKVSVKGTVVSIKNEYTRRGFRLQKAVISDGSGEIEVVWFNQQYLLSIIHTGDMLALSGTVKFDRMGYSINPLEYEVIAGSKQLIHTCTIVPIYSEKVGLSSRTIREKMFSVLPMIEEKISALCPDKLAKKHNLIQADEAYRSIHFPMSFEKLESSRKRLGFDELFVLHLNSQIIRQRWQSAHVIEGFSFDEKDKAQIKKFTASLPFTLTGAQQRAVDDIFSDLAKTYPANRLLQGDVGSGKTIVGALGAYATKLAGFKTLLMAPTEILAFPHYESIRKLFKKEDISIALYTGSQKASASELEKADMIIGTHALIGSKFKSDRVGLVIIDEQHKFGVAQRMEFKGKAGMPHHLSMTATPIPRTVTLTLYGELDISIIDEFPPGRTLIKSHVVPLAKREACYEWIVTQIKQEKSQVFLVCPLIDESESETLKDVKAAKFEFEKLSKGPFKGLSVGLLHGRLKSKEKESIMNDFSAGKIDILISTPVAEVGVDIPNATIIVIEAAERFGLAQLHQLRGRVGRGEKKSYCYVFTEKVDDTILKRLQFFTKTSEGFALAEFDLKSRGSGDIFGLKQHGLSRLRLASYTDFELSKKARDAASSFLKTDVLEKYPRLYNKITEFENEKVSND